MRIDHVLIGIDFAFFMLAIFFSGFTSQVADPNLRIQLVALSSSFFVGGIVIVIALVLLYIFKNTLFRKRRPESGKERNGSLQGSWRVPAFRIVVDNRQKTVNLYEYS